jgi:hypothetical protein
MNTPHLENVNHELQSIIQSMKRLGVQDAGTRERLNRLYEYIFKYPYSLASIVFGSTIIYLSSKEVEREPEIIDIVGKELKGQERNWNTTAIKHDFTLYLSDKFCALYRGLQKIVTLLNQEDALGSGTIELIDSYADDLYEGIETEIPETIDDLIIITACNVLFLLPSHYPKHFDLSDERGGYGAKFSSIGSRDIMVDIDEHISYIVGLLDKLEGKRTLYVDVSIISEYHLINLR